MTSREPVANIGAEAGTAAAQASAEAQALAHAWLDMFDPPAFDWLATPARHAWLADNAAQGAAGELDAPAPEIVRCVNDKAFTCSQARELALCPALIRSLVEVLSPEDCVDPDFAARIAGRLEAWPAWTGQNFTLKPRLGTAGRGRVSRLSEIPGAAKRLARAGGAILEPWLERTHDLSVQLYISRAGELEVLGSTDLLTSPPGVAQGVAGRIADDGRSSSHSEHDDATRTAALQLAQAAHNSGYFGPCGVDAFEFRGPEGLELRPLVELNARFTMGTVALGQVSRARPSAGRAFVFLPLAEVEAARAFEHNVLGPIQNGRAPVIAFSSQADELLARLR